MDFGFRSTGVEGISDLLADGVLKKLETWGALPVCVLWPLSNPSSTCDWQLESMCIFILADLTSFPHIGQSTMMQICLCERSQTDFLTKVAVNASEIKDKHLSKSRRSCPQVGCNLYHEGRLPAGCYASDFAEDICLMLSTPPLSHQIRKASNVDRNNSPRSFQARCQSCRPEAGCLVRTRSLLDI